MNFFFDHKKIMNAKIEQELLKNERSRPLVELAKKYGIEGLRIMEFMADLATVAQQMQQEEASE